MDDEGERGHETAVLREVRDDHGMIIVAAELGLERRPPGVEERLRVGREAEERALRWGELLGVEGGEVEGGELAVEGERARPGVSVGPPIDVAPPRGRIGAHRELKPLNEAVVAAAGEGLVQIGVERTRLDPAEQRDTSRLDAQS